MSAAKAPGTTPSKAARPSPAPLGGTSLRARPRVSDEIIRVLIDQVASGQLPRGSRLPNERDMAGHFGVSQPTVREAIRALGAMGLVDVRHGSGAYVTGDPRSLVGLALRTLLQLEHVSILQVLDVRMTLGRYAARSAASMADGEDVARVVEAVAALEDVTDAHDVRDIAERVVAFQVALTFAAHNPLLQAIETFLIVLLMQFQVADRTKDLAFWRRWTARFVPDRRRIVQALQARDETAMVESVAGYLQALHVAFDADPALGSVRLSDPDVLKTLSRIVLAVPNLGVSD